MKIAGQLAIDIAKALLLTIVFFLIKIGDFITFVWTSIVQVPKKIFGLAKFKRQSPQNSLQKKVRSSRKRARTSYSPSIFYKLKFFILGGFVSFLFLFIPLLMFLFVQELPSPSSLASANAVSKTTKIYDRNGELLYEIFANQNRTLVKLDEVPKDLKNATIAIEDRDFYSHPGFDLRGILRAVLSNVRTDQLQGGSTITQQLIKSSLLTPETTLMRKAKEVLLAFWAERMYSKDQILEMYFNYVPYGGTAWGAEAASEAYFGKQVSQLTLAESAFLAGLPRAPSIYSPYAGEDGLWKQRQKDVLDAMVRNSYISRQQAQEAYAQELSFKGSEVPIKAPHFVMYVRNLLVEKYGLYEVERGGLTVRTSLDLSKQRMAESIVKDEVEANEYLNISNGAAIISDPKNGDILAMVGSRDYFDVAREGNVNIATSLRQPGSTIKVVTYTLALTKGFTEASIIDDTPMVVRSEGEAPYIPVNYDGAFHGKVPLRIALANSYNIPAVRLAQNVGVESIVKMGRDMGIASWQRPSRYGLSITLGGAEVTMLDMTTVYGTLANGGKRATLDPILDITDSNGNTVYKKNSQPIEVVDEGVAYIISDILADNNARSRAFGPNSVINIPDNRVSVKTGTTDNKRDNWTIGYTNDYVVTTWVGNNNNSMMSPFLTSGVTGAAPMWSKIMKELLVDMPSQIATPPDSVIQRSCFGYNAYFVRGTENITGCRLVNNPPGQQPSFIQ